MDEEFKKEVESGKTPAGWGFEDGEFKKEVESDRQPKGWGFKDDAEDEALAAKIRASEGYDIPFVVEIETYFIRAAIGLVLAVLLALVLLITAEISINGVVSNPITYAIEFLLAALVLGFGTPYIFAQYGHAPVVSWVLENVRCPGCHGEVKDCRCSGRLSYYWGGGRLFGRREIGSKYDYDVHCPKCNKVFRFEQNWLSMELTDTEPDSEDSTRI